MRLYIKYLRPILLSHPVLPQCFLLSLKRCFKVETPMQSWLIHSSLKASNFIPSLLPPKQNMNMTENEVSEKCNLISNKHCSISKKVCLCYFPTRGVLTTISHMHNGRYRCYIYDTGLTETTLFYRTTQEKRLQNYTWEVILT